MKIRSITCFIDLRHDPEGQQLGKLAEFCNAAARQLAQQGVEVQSTRLSSPPFPEWVDCTRPSEAIDLVTRFQVGAEQHGFAYVSCGPSVPDQPDSEVLVPGLLEAVKGAFVSSIIADNHSIYPRSIHHAAETIKQASMITPDGFTNLNFAALANTRAYGPFFPGSYAAAHGKPAYSLAIECADAVVSAFTGDAALDGMRRRLTLSLEAFARELSAALDPLAYAFDIEFKGFDFSPAPFPEAACSLGGGIEALGIGLGKHGALAAAAVVADTLDAGRWKRAGFNGLMLPVLEDALLAERAADGQLSVKDLLLYSAVCGTGLDTVPLPGDISVPEIESILWDVAALAVRLGKPLTARLMPVPGKKSGDPTEFNFGYFANSRIMRVEGQSVRPPLDSSDPVLLRPRDPNSHH